MRNYFIVSVLCLALFQSNTLSAAVRLYEGTLEVVKTSGKACSDLKGNHKVSIVVGTGYPAEYQDSIFGYIGGDTVTVGQLRSQPHDLSTLALRYPYPDSERAEGHSLRVEFNGKKLNGELSDRHIDDNADDCNFDLARIELSLNESDEAASKVYQRLAGLYEGQLARSAAIFHSKKGEYATAVELYEKALSILEKLYPPDSVRLTPYLTGLANSYMRAGRYADFNRLYDSRIANVHNAAVKEFFNHHQIRSLLQVGRAAMGREDYQTAIYNFRRALKIDYKNKDAIASNMSALVRSGKHDEAINFLEETEQKLENEPDRKDVREAIALVVYQKSKKEDKDGKRAEAERSLRKAIKLDPGTPQYLIALARLLHKDGKYSEADGLLKRGANLFSDASSRSELEEAREKMRRTEKILARIRKVGS